jgi:hypothetical protein
MTDSEQTPEGKAYDSNEVMKIPRSGGAPRPATEPEGAEHMPTSAQTATDPATGEPNRTPRR